MCIRDRYDGVIEKKKIAYEMDAAQRVGKTVEAVVNTVTEAVNTVVA